MSKLVERRLNDFKRRCGKDGNAALQLAYHAAMPVALNPELLHFLRINFFVDPPEQLPYTVEFEFLTSGLCREIDAELYEIEPEIRNVLLQRLMRREDARQRIRDVATLLWQYVEHHSPWADRVELERSQQLTALNFLDPAKAKQWLNEAEANGSLGTGEREWFVAMREEIEQIPQHKYRKLQELNALEKLYNLRAEKLRRLENALMIETDLARKFQLEKQIEDERAQLHQLDQALEKDDLSSDKGVDYTRLRDLLAAGKWKEADEETLAVMLKAAEREKDDWLDVESIENFPCTDLRTIDQLWVKYSNGRFGFSMQKRIWESVGGNPNADYETFEKFGDRVGWRVKEIFTESRVTYNTTAPWGHLPVVCFVFLDVDPVFGAVGTWVHLSDQVFSSLASRLVNCNI